MASPVPVTPSFSKKVWSSELIPSEELNRIENAIEDLFAHNVLLTGKKTFSNDAWFAGLYVTDDGVSQGQLRYVDDKLLIESYSDDPSVFWERSTPGYTNIEIGAINTVLMDAHKVRHNIGGDDYWSRMATAIVSAAGDAEFAEIQDAIAYCNTNFPGGSRIIVKEGAYNAFSMSDNQHIVGVGKASVELGTNDVFMGDRCSIIGMSISLDVRQIVNSIIAGCYFPNTSLGKIRMSGFRNIAVGNTFELGTSENGIYSQAIQSIIAGNIFKNVDYPIKVLVQDLGGSILAGTRNLIINNIIWTSKSTGIAIEMDKVGGSGDGLNIVGGNEILGPYNIGVKSHSEVDRVIVSGNRIEGATTPTDVTGAGVIVTDNK